MGRRIIGKCLLTGVEGSLAKAHIIPDAFMRRATDAPFMECDAVSRSRKRFSGWYDYTILGDEGEKIIASYDDVAAKSFVENGFTYRKRRDPSDIDRLEGGPIAGQIYEVAVDTAKIRLFALSLLWRAAVTKLEALNLVKVSPSHLADIGKRVLVGDAGPYTEYPVYFGVFCDGEEMTKIAPFRPKNHPFYRFFLDGVICYVCPRRHLKGADAYGLVLAGAEPNQLKLQCFQSVGSNHSIYAEEAAQAVAAREGNIFSGFEAAARRRR